MTGEDRERRELERRAYGREGSGLTPAEAARLAELRSRPAPLPEALSPVPETLEDASPDPVPPFTTPRSALAAWLADGPWKRPRYLVGGLALLLLAGVALGASIPRQPDTGLALRAGEAERRDDVAKSGKYDPGSVVLLDRSDDVLLWTATLTNGKYRCAILDAPSLPPQKQCQNHEDARRRGFSLQAQWEVPRGDDAQGHRVVYAGTIFTSGNGVVGGAIQRWETDPRIRNQGMSDEEVATSARIAMEQHVESPSIAGRWQGLVIWRGYADNGSTQCLIVEAPAPRKACSAIAVPIQSPSQSAEGPSVTIELPATDVRPSARIEWRRPLYAAEYLVITENAEVVDPSLFPPR